MASQYSSIIFRKAGNVAWITLNRPERLNALNHALSTELVNCLLETDLDPEVRVIVITGAGRGFCSGADFKPGAVTSDLPRESWGIDGRRQGMRRGFQLITKTIRNLDKPTIASVNGACTGGGLDIALACDLRIGSDQARFQVAFVKRGVLPYTGGTFFLPRVVGLAKALEMLYTGDFMDGQEAERYGLLNKLVPHDQLEEATQELAAKIAKGPPIALRLGKLMMVRGLELGFETSLEMAAIANVIPQLSEDANEGRRSFEEKRDPNFRGL